MKYLYYFICLNLVVFGNVVSKDTTQIFSLAKLFLKLAKNKGEVLLEKSGGNTQCVKDLKVLIGDVIFGKKWALEMLDASAKLPSGLLQWNHFIPGNFDQCINIKEEKNETVIHGQYCSVLLTPSKEFSNEFTSILDGVSFSSYIGKNVMRYEDFIKLIKITYGICIPHSCSIANLQTIWNYLEHSFRFPIHVAFVDFLCSSRSKVVEGYKYIDECIMVILIIYASILILSTLYDVLVYQHLQEKADTILISFSVYTNARKLFSSRNHDENILDCVNGLKVLSISWVIFGHRFLMNGLIGIQNFVYLHEWNQQIFSTLVYSALFAVDTFFVLSGLLISFNFLKYHGLLIRNGRINFSMFYTYRLLRLLPALFATILFYITIFKKLGDGPMWPLLSRKFGGSCLTSGWATMLFVSNFVPFNKQCLEQSWYLAVDTQIYIIAPVLLVNLLKNPKKTIRVIVIGCLLSGIYTFVITLVYNYGALVTEGNLGFYRNIYNSTVVRMPSWLIGFIFGYLIFKYQHSKIPKPAALAAWIITLSMMVFLILIHLLFTRNNYSPLSAAIFNSCAKQLWSLTIGSVVLLCVTGNGGIINSFLSLPIFKIVVKINYSMYLIHIAVLTYFAASKRHSGYFSNMKGLHDFAGDLVFIIIISTVWCLAFESPFLSMAKMWYKKDEQRSIMKENLLKEVDIGTVTICTGANKDKTH